MALEDIGVRVLVIGGAEFRRAMGSVRDDLDRTEKQITSLSSVSVRMGQDLQKIGSIMMSLGRTMTIGVTLPLGILEGALIAAGIQFEDTFAGIGKTAEGVSVGFEEIAAAAKSELGIVITTMDEAKAAAERMGMRFGDLTTVGMRVREEFRQLALTIPMPTEQLNQLGEVVGQLGVGTETIAKVTRIIAELGVTTDMSAESAAMALVRFLNIMTDLDPASDEFADTLERLASTVVDLGNKSVATESEIMNLALRIAAAGNAADLSSQEVLAWATTLADVGTRAEMGGTAVSRMITEMLLAVQAGGDGLDEFARVAGVSVDEFVRLFREDASGALKQFIDGFTKLWKTGGITKKMLQDMGLSGVRAIDVMGRLSAAAELFDKNLGNANSAWEQNIALQQEAEKRFATVKNQLVLLGNAFKDLGITIFDLVREHLKAVIDAVRSVIDWFKALSDETKMMILKFVTIAIAIGPVLIVLGTLISLMGTAITAVVGLASSLAPLIAVLLAVAGTLALLQIDPFQVLRDATGNTQGTLETIRQAFDDVDFWARRVLVTLQGILKEISKFANAEAFQPTIEALQKIAGLLGIKPAAAQPLPAPVAGTEGTGAQGEPRIQQGIIPAGMGGTVPMQITPLPIKELRELADTIMPALNAAFTLLKNTINEISPFVEQIIESLKPIWDRNMETATSNLALAWERFKEAVAKLWPLIQPFIEDTLVSGILLLAYAVSTLVIGISWAINLFSALLTLVGPLIEAFVSWRIGLYDLTQGIRSVISGLWNLITTGEPTVANISKIIGGLEQLIGGFLRTSATASRVKDIVLGAFGAILLSVRGFVDDVVGFFNDLYVQLVGGSIIPDMVTSILTEFGNLLAGVITIVGQIVQEVIKAASGIAGIVAGIFAGGQPAAPAGGGEVAPGAAQAAAVSAMLTQITAKVVELQTAFTSMLSSLTAQIMATLAQLNEGILVTGTTISVMLSTISVAVSTLILLLYTQVGLLTTAVIILFTTLTLSLNMIITQLVLVMTTYVPLIVASIMTIGATLLAAFALVVPQVMALFAGLLAGTTLFLAETILLFGAFVTAAMSILERLNVYMADLKLHMVGHWRDFLVAAQALTADFVVKTIGQFERMHNTSVGKFHEMRNEFGEMITGMKTAVNSDAIPTLNSLAAAFSSTGGAATGLAATVQAAMIAICQAVQDAEECATGSPELRIQHPFERFEKFMKQTDIAKQIERQLAPTVLTEANLRFAPAQAMGDTYNDNSISAEVSGVPMTDERSMSAELLRMARTMQLVQGRV